MTKTTAKEIAKETLLEALGIAYYKLVDDGEYTEEEVEMICVQMNKLGERMAKSVNGRYVTY